jgi:hypothetical protein
MQTKCTIVMMRKSATPRIAGKKERREVPHRETLINNLKDSISRLRKDFINLHHKDFIHLGCKASISPLLMASISRREFHHRLLRHRRHHAITSLGIQQALILTNRLRIILMACPQCHLPWRTLQVHLLHRLLLRTQVILLLTTTRNRNRFFH